MAGRPRPRNDADRAHEEWVFGHLGMKPPTTLADVLCGARCVGRDQAHEPIDSGPCTLRSGHGGSHSSGTANWGDSDAPAAVKPEYVYVASSWRNMLQTGVVHVLRAASIACYDFREPEPGVEGFSWKEAGDVSTPGAWRTTLSHPAAQRGYALDKAAMDRADCCVLVLPCGRSAHLEAGYMAGRGKPVFTLAVDSVGHEPELMTLLLGPPENVCLSVVELLGKLGVED